MVLHSEGGKGDMLGTWNLSFKKVEFFSWLEKYGI